jgi:hypothetical protein
MGEAVGKDDHLAIAVLAALSIASLAKAQSAKLTEAGFAGKWRAERARSCPNEKGVTSIV